MLIGTLSALTFASIASGPGDLPMAPVLASVHLAYDTQLDPPEPIFNFSLLQDADPISSYGDQGSTRLTIQGAAAVHEDENYFFDAGFGFEHFIEENLSLVTQFNGVYVDQEEDDAGGGNFVLLIRWHFHARETWSAYVEAGAGMLWTSNDVPADGSSFNFTPQAAIGLTFDIGEDNRAHLALGWHHISNAQIYDDNPGRDSIILHAGLSFPF